MQHHQQCTERWEALWTERNSKGWAEKFFISLPRLSSERETCHCLTTSPHLHICVCAQLVGLCEFVCFSMNICKNRRRACFLNGHYEPCDDMQLLQEVRSRGCSYILDVVAKVQIFSTIMNERKRIYRLYGTCFSKGKYVDPVYESSGFMLKLADNDIHILCNLGSSYCRLHHM